jgi:hypothetical protein
MAEKIRTAINEHGDYIEITRKDPHVRIEVGSDDGFDSATLPIDMAMEFHNALGKMLGVESELLPP